MKPDSALNPRFHPLEALAGWLIPGLGHIILGQVARGLIVMAAVVGLWLGGMLIGGIGVIDSQSPPEARNQPPKASLWFFGQALVGPSLGVNWFVQSVNSRNRSEGQFSPAPEEHPVYDPSLGHPNELGTLYTALAGMLNLLAILDVAYCDAEARRRAPQPVTPGEGSAPPPAAPNPADPKGAQA
jgi:hypothetical protein